MIMEILTRSGGILSYLQDILGGILSSSTKKSGGGFCPGGILSYTQHCHVELYKNPANFAPGVKYGPTPGVIVGP